MFTLQGARGLELRLRQVQPDRTRTHPREPGAPVAGPAAEVEYIAAFHVRQDPKLRLGDVPLTPAREGTRPRPPAELDPVRRILVPHRARTHSVFGQLVLVRNDPTIPSS